MSRRGVHGQIVDAIARRIVSGEIGEGQTLNLPALCTELEVSLTALREALKVLSAKGIVDARQRRGTFVRPRADWNLLDSEVIGWQLSDPQNKQILENLHELRMIIEPVAARLAAERATADQILALDAAIAAMADAPDLATLVASDLRFHRLLMQSTGNDLLKSLDAVVEADVAERIRPAIGHHTENAVRAHYTVLVAIRARDGDAAEEAVRDLITYVEQS